MALTVLVLLKGSGTFITKDIYWMLYEMNASEKLSKVIRDINKLRDLLMKDAFWTDEYVEETCAASASGGCVGNFTLNGKDIEAEKYELKNGSLIGEMIVGGLPKNEEGNVSFSLETGLFEIQYSRELLMEERVIVENTFNLRGMPCHYVCYVR